MSQNLLQKPAPSQTLPEIPDSWTEPERIGDRLRYLAESIPDWGPAHRCRERIEQFSQRTSAMQRRLGMPLIVAFLGGTGTGKSTLINALLGAQVVREGKQRPTTDQPILVCRPEIRPEDWGIDISDIKIEKLDSPALRKMVLIDCPDPDTTENEQQRLSNLARLRSVLPLCDILVITGTQQKYRSRKVADELADAAPGARLVFVQTHSDRDVDIRNDWKEVLQEKYETGTIFLVDSKTALTEQLAGKELQGEFADLYKLLTHDLSEEHALRIRLANYFDLAEETVVSCWETTENDWKTVQKLQTKINEERRELSLGLAEKVRTELISDRRLWENRLVDRLTNIWGYSPFSALLRVYRRLGSLTMGYALMRARSIPQLAALGAVEGVRNVRRWSNERKLKQNITLPEYWDENTLRESNLILSGFAQDAKIPPEPLSLVLEEAVNAGDSFVGVISREMQSICEHLTVRFNTKRTRIVYESILMVISIFVLSRPTYNFFYKSWYTDIIWPLSNYVVCLFWLGVLSAILLGVFLLTISRAMERKINETSANWSTTESMRSVFQAMDSTIEKVRSFREKIHSIRERLDHLNKMGESLDRRLGRRKT